MSNQPNSFVIGFSEECSFPEVIEKLTQDGLINIAEWVVTNNRGTIDLMEFYHGKYFNKHEIKHQLPEDLRQKVSQYIFEFCYINSRTNLSHSCIDKVHSNIYEEIHEFWKFIYLIYDIFVSKNVDLVIFQEVPHDGAEIALYRLAKAMNIKTIILANFTHFWGRSFAFYSLEDFGDFKEIPDLSNDADDFKIDYQDFKGKIFYMKKICNYDEKLSLLQKHLLKLKKKYLIKSLSKLFFNIRKFDKVQFAFAASIIQLSRVLEYKNNVALATISNADLTKKYVYFALHLDPEVPTVPPLAGIYYDQLVAIEKLSAVIPDDMMIYVKENPKQTDILRPNSFFDRLKSLKNVKLVDEDTYKLIDQSCFVATIAGTAGWEAITGGKNALIFGKSWYQTLPGVFKFSENLNVEDIINYKVDKNELEIGVKKIINKSGHGMIYFDFNNKNMTKINDIYPQYNRADNVNHLYYSIKTLIIHKNA